MRLQILVRQPDGALRATVANAEDSVAAVAGLGCQHAAGPAAEGTLRVVHGGRTLNPWQSLAAAGVQPGSTLELLPRLRGGGGDGGSTGAESRSCYLEMYAGKKKDKVNPEEERLARWTTCQLSGLALQPPCVADELGSLFNKDAVLQALLSKSMPKSLAHISSLKHLTELKLEAAAGSGDGAANGSTNGGGGGAAAACFACPITGLAFNGKARFVVLRKTGHVVSERALKEVPAVVEELAGGKWEPQDLLVINPAGEELDQLREKLLLKRAAERAAKKDKKKDKAAVAAANGSSTAAAAAAAAGGEGAGESAAGSKRAAENGSGGGAAAAVAGANGGSEAAAAAAKRCKVAELKPKRADDKVWNSLFTSSSGRGDGKGNDYMCRAATRYVS